MTSYAAAVNCFRVKCPDGTYREPTPGEVKAAVKSYSYVSLSGHRFPSSPAQRAAERAGDLDGAISHARRIVAETVSEIVNPTF
jgi:hypothetical protein